MAELSDLAQDFADRLTARFAQVLADCPEFVALVRPIAAGGRGRVSISTYDRTSLRQQPILMVTTAGDAVRLRVKYECCWDTGQDFLAIEESEFKVLPSGNRDVPLFRFEYVRTLKGAPAAHVQAHGHRDELVHLMTRAGRRSQEKKASRIPRLQDVHLPVGGHRFRPCVEDVLDFVADELGVALLPGYETVLKEGRAEWRRLQLRAAVRDAPAEAVAALRDLGYEIRFPGDEEPTENLERLMAR